MTRNRDRVQSSTLRPRTCWNCFARSEPKRWPEPAAGIITQNFTVQTPSRKSPFPEHTNIDFVRAFRSQSSRAASSSPHHSTAQRPRPQGPDWWPEDPRSPRLAERFDAADLPAPTTPLPSHSLYCKPPTGDQNEPDPRLQSYWPLISLRPRYTAALPSSSAMRNKRLYFATRSLRLALPVLIWPAAVPTAKSAMVVSSVSPER